MRRKKVKVKYKNILILIIFIVFIVIISKSLSSGKNINTADIIDSYVGKDISVLEKLIKEDNLELEKKYEFNKEYNKDEKGNTYILHVCVWPHHDGSATATRQVQPRGIQSKTRELHHGGSWLYPSRSTGLLPHLF